MNQQSSESTNVNAETLVNCMERVESLIENANFQSQVPATLPQSINFFPFNVGIVRKTILKIYWIFFKKQRVVNESLGLAIKELLKINKKLITEGNSLQSQTIGLNSVTSSPYNSDLLNLNHLLRSQNVEPYQPLYQIPESLTDFPSKRECRDRCSIIEKKLLEFGDNLSGIRLLDVGSSLGYNSFYFADKGMKVVGIENTHHNVEVSRLTSKISGLHVDFKLREFDLDYVKSLQKSEYDVVFFLSVLHHITFFNGLEYTQDMMAEIVKRIPVIIVELAVKEEHSETINLRWRETLPENPLDIFAKCGDLEITLLGQFPTHLSPTGSPLYAIS